MISADSFATIGTDLMIGGGVVFGWWHSWGSWEELRRDWQDFRAAARDTRENTRERQEFARGRSCSRCQASLVPRRLFRAVRHDPPASADARWVYRCRCGESTLYDADGKAHHLEPASAA